MLFGILFLALELIVILEGWLTWKRGFFIRGQGRVSDKPKVGYFIEHVGMWGDFFLISPLVAFIGSSYSKYWSHNAIGLCLALCALACIFLSHQANKISLGLDDSFHENGRVLPTGVLHYVYASIVITAILLYYFRTPRAVTREHALLVTSVLGFHAGIGVLIPPYITFHRIRRGDILMVTIAWASLLFGFWKITG